MKLPAALFDACLWRILLTLLKFLGRALLDLISADGSLTPEEQRRLKAGRIRQLLIDLGPTYIKVGQFLSVRRDILPLEIAEELSLLQDKVPPFELELVRKTIVGDLGKAPEDLFTLFDPVPLASASIGQVHRAQLADGRAVAVKVQRPDLALTFLRDLGYMRMCAKAAALFIGSGRALSWLALADEFGRTLFSEIDYLKEGRHADRLRRVLRGQPRVRVPRVYWKHTGKRVLTLEYLPGIKINQVEELQAKGVDLRDLGNRLIECYMEQILFHGFFHADPHPGNLAVDESGHLIIYDFGMMGVINGSQQAALSEAVAAVIKKDAQQLVQSLVKLQVVRAGARTGPIVRAIEPFIDYYCGRDILEIDFQQIEQEVDHIILDQALCLPATLAYLLRASSSLEGIARTLRPNFSFVAAARPVLNRWLMEKAFSSDSLRDYLNICLGGLKSPDGKGQWIKAPLPNHPRKSALQAGEPAHLGPESLRLDGLNVKERNVETSLMELRVLHNQLQKSLSLVFLSLFLVSVAMLFLGATLVPELRPFSRYILIGNGVLGAIIILVAVKPSRRFFGSGGIRSGRGNGDQ